MKIQIVLLLTLVGLSLASIENSFLEQELAEYGSLRLWVNNYLGVTDGPPLAENLKSFSYQYNINYIDDVYKMDNNQVIYLRRFVDRFVRTIPIPQWPMVIRYMVFPQIYGYYSNQVITNYLVKLYRFEDHYHSFITGDSFSFGAANDMFSAISAEEQAKLRQLEKLSRLEQLKREVDQNLLTQTQQLLEAQDYEKKIDQLVQKVNLLAEKMKSDNNPQDAAQIQNIQNILNSVVDSK